MTLHEWLLALHKTFPEALAALLAVFFASTGVGMALLKRFPLRHLLFPATVLGGNILALGCFALHRQIPAMPESLLWGIFMLPALYGLWCWRLFPFRRNIFCVAVFAAAGIFTLGSALILPYAWDEQVYQIALPVRYLAENSAGVVLDNSYSAFPAYPHFLMLAGIRMGGVLFPRLLVWGSYLLLFAWFYRGVRRFGRWNALFITAALAISPLVLAMNRETYQEPFIVLNLFPGISLLYVLRRRTVAGGILGGICAGMTLAVKLTAGGIAGGMAIFSFAILKRRIGTLCFCIAAALTALPFYLRSFLATGNFFYPFGSGIFAPDSAAAAVERYHTQLGRHLYGSGLEGIFTGWLNIAFAENLYDGIILGLQYPVMLGVIAVVCFKRKKINLILFCAILFPYLFWALSSQQTRFLLPWYFCIAFPAAASLHTLSRNSQRIIQGTLFATSLISLFPPALLHYSRSWGVLRHSARCTGNFLGYATQEPEYFNMLDFIGTQTPADAKIMLLFERRGLYVPRRYVIGTPCFQERFFAPLPEAAAGVLAELRNAGISYILVGASLRDPDPIPDYEALNAAFASKLIELLRQNALSLVEVPGSGDYTLLKVN